MKKEFENNTLRKLDPAALISKNGELTREEKGVADLLLTLAMVFNDLKGLMILHDEFVDNYEKPTSEEETVHLGEYNGLNLQCLKLLIGTLSETLKLLKEQAGIISSPEFKKYSDQMTRDSLEHWETLNVVANARRTKLASSYAKRVEQLLQRIRNNVAFHYYESGKNLRAGFISRFLKGTDDAKREWAYYSSLKTSFSKTRYYYADAALERFLAEQLGEVGDMKKVSDEIFDITGYTLNAICNLLDVYHGTKPMAEAG